MGRQEYLNKSNDEKSVLIIKYYNAMVKDNIYKLSLLSFSISFSSWIKFDSTLSAIVSLIMFLSVDLISSGKVVCWDLVCSESLSEESINGATNSLPDSSSEDSLPVDSSSDSDSLYELNKKRFLMFFC